MNDEKRQEYTRRITSDNKSQLIVTIYDIALEYIDESKKAIDSNDKAEFRKNVARAQKCVESLIAALNFDYEMAHPLWHIYFYINKKMSYAIKTTSYEPLKESYEILFKLRGSFDEISKLDNSKPMMDNTQSVIAGMTYGKTTLNEAVQNNGENRGYFA